MKERMAIVRRPFLAILFLAAGCVPMAEIDIRVLDPAELTLPLSVQQVAFMNRAVFPHILKNDTSGWTKQEYYILDTIVNNWIFQGVRSAMMESPLYDLDTIRVIRSRRRDTTTVLDPLTVVQMQMIKQVHPADAVISLEYYTLYDSIGVTYNAIEGRYEAYLGIYTTVAWRIYDLARDTVIDEYAFKETSDWVAFADGYKSSLAKLPETIDAIRAAAFTVGEKYGERISPGWMEVIRFYHVWGSKEIREAGKLAARGDWNNAAGIWKRLAYGEDEKTAARACFNMALLCETEDLLLPALDWAIKSYSIRQEDLTRDYIDLLKNRYEDRKKLREQIPYVE